MKLTQEQYDSLPDFMKSEYTKVGEEYQHAGMLKVKQTADSLNEKLEDERKERMNISSRLDEIEKSKAEEIEQARLEALENARSKGDVEAIEKRYQEQMDDLKTRSEERENALQAELDEFKGSVKGSIKTGVIAELSTMATDVGKLAFQSLVSSRIDVDLSTKKPVFLNADGSASSLDMNGFKNEIKKDPMFKALLKADQATTGGGNANGGMGGSASVKPFKEMTGKERLELKQSDPELFKQLSNSRG